MSLFKFSGVWQSDRSPNIKGQLSIDLPVMLTDVFDTELVLTYEHNSSFRPGDTLSFPMSGNSLKGSDSEYVLCTKSRSGQQFAISLYEGDIVWEWRGTYICFNPADVGNISIKCETTCWGCIEDQANQLAHMNPDGCLFDDRRLP